jgi:hypothetical protein
MIWRFIRISLSETAGLEGAQARRLHINSLHRICVRENRVAAAAIPEPVRPLETGEMAKARRHAG